MPCEQCHGGNPDDDNWQSAHEGVIKDPTFPNPEKVCGECHEEITSTAPYSLHYTVAPIYATIEARASVDQPAIMKTVRMAQSKHCSACHASCGQCHVSRPAYVQGGFLSKHHFKKPPMETVCAGCHGGRVFAEYTGSKEDYEADVHFSKAEMKCAQCHSAVQMHADDRKATHRFQVEHRPSCRNCHPDAVQTDSQNPYHASHKGRLACQVCHAQANKNCFNCHVGTDKKGLAYYKCEKTRMLFKIGRNPQKSAERAYDYVVLRHAPVNPGLFDDCCKNALGRFNRLPTWKLDTPHSIRRHTPQTKTCNACHGQAGLFLRAEDLADGERSANSKVIVPEANLPKPIKEAKNES